MAIDWRPIDELPDELKDGREVLVWDGDCADVATWSARAHFGRGGPGWSDTGEGGEITGVTHFVEIHAPGATKHEHSWIEITQKSDKVRRFVCAGGCQARKEEPF